MTGAAAPPLPADCPPFLRGTKCGALIAAKDWSSTPLGPVSAWPASLRTTVGLMLPSPAPMVLLWGERGVLLYNDAYAAIAGNRHPSLLGRPVAEAWPEVADFNAHVLATGLGGEPLSYRNQPMILHRNERAEQAWFNLDYSPVPGCDGTPAGVLCVCIETTELVTTEERRRAERTRLMRMYDQAPGIICLLDGPDHVFVLSNQAHREAIGGADVVGKSLREAHPELEGQGLFELFDGVYRSGKPYRTRDFSSRIARGGSEPEFRRYDFIIQPVFDDAGSVTGTFLLGSDITESRAAEERLRDTAERLRLAASSAGIGTWDLDLVTGRGHWDEVTLKFGGFDPVEGRTFSFDDWLALVDEADQAQVQERFQKALEPHAPSYSCEFRAAARAEDGSVRWIAAHGTVLRDEETGEPLRAIGIVRDITAEKLATAALEESEARFRMLADSVPCFVWFADSAGEVEFVNTRWYDYTGRAPGPASDAGWADVAHPDDIEQVRSCWSHSVATGDSYATECRYRRHDGVYRWHSVRAEPVRDEEGRIVRWFGSTYDIDEQKQATQRLEVALDAGAIQGTWVWDVPNDRVTADERFGNTFGIPADECRRGFPIVRAVNAIHPDDQPRVAEAINASLASGGSYRVEYRVRNIEGQYRWVEASGEVDLAADGTPLRFAGVAVDLEARRALEAERDRAKALLEALFQTVPGAVYAKDVEGRILLGNPGFAQAVQHTPEEFLGKTDLELLDDKERARKVMDNDRAIMASGRTVQIEEELANAEGKVSHWLSIKTPLLDSEGEVAGVVGISLDMTERRLAEERMRLLAREVDHRAKNLLGVVQSVVQLTRAEDVAAFKAAVSGRVHALARAHSLLAESRWEGVEIGKLAREELAPFLKPGSARVRIDGPALRLRPSGSQALALVLHELATNSTKYGSLGTEQGELDLCWRFIEDGSRLELLWVEAGGPPVAPPTRQGFGSTVVRLSIERQLNGSIALDWLPEGLRCRIEVPAAQLAEGQAVAEQETAPSAAPEPGGETSLAGLRALIVDDEPLIAHRIATVARRLGCEIVGPVATVNAALDLVRQRAPDLAVLDVNLDGENSAPVAQALGALGVPFVYLSGYATPGEGQPGADDAPWLTKPVEPEVLTAALTRAARRGIAALARSPIATNAPG